MIPGVAGATAAGGGLPKLLGLALSSTPYVAVYEFSNTFGARYSNPATTPTGSGNGVAWSSTGAQIVVAHTTSPFVTGYPFTPSGFGTKYANPATLPGGQANAVGFSASDAYISLATDTAPRYMAYPISASGFGTKVADPASLPATGSVWATDWKASTDVAFVNDAGVFAVYPFTTSFGTRYGVPGTVPSAPQQDMAWRASGDYITSVSTTSPYIDTYVWSAGFGARVANPATLPAGASYAVKYRGSTEIAVGHATSPFITVYPFTGTYGTKYANPGTLPAGTTLSTTWSTDGGSLFVSGFTTPYLEGWAWSSGFGSKYSNPATAVADQTNDIAFV
jgi:hypothetical protein